MRTGLQEVKESIDRAKAKSSGTNTGRGLNYFSFKSGEKKILRFLTDDVITANFYEFICNNDGRPHDFLYAPDVLEGAEDYVAKYGGRMFERGMSGPLVDPIMKERTVALAVLREEVPTKDGLRLQDYEYEVESNGQQYKARWFGIVKQAQQNFWTHLVAASNRYGGTICNRDYEISREGTGFDTKYHIIPIDPDPDLKDLDTVKKFYGYGKEFDQSDPDRFLFCPQTLHDWAKNYASEERVKYWLAPKEGGTTEPSGMDEFASATTSNSGDEAQVVTPQSTDFGSLKERLLKNK